MKTDYNAVAIKIVEEWLNNGWGEAEISTKDSNRLVELISEHTKKLEDEIAFLRKQLLAECYCTNETPYCGNCITLAKADQIRGNNE